MDFYRIEHHTIMDGLVVRYRELSERDYIFPFEISASRSEVHLAGAEHAAIETQQDISDLITVIERAWQQHNALKAAQAQGGTAGASLPFDRDPDCVVEFRKARFADQDVIIERRRRGERP